MLTISEYHRPGLAFEYIFQQKLGLLTCPDFHLGVFCDWHEKRGAMMQQMYSKAAQKASLPYPLFYHAANLDSIADQAIRQIIEFSLQALQENYPLSEYCRDFTFVLQPLRQRSGRDSRVSSSFEKIVDETKQDMSLC